MSNVKSFDEWTKGGTKIEEEMMDATQADEYAKQKGINVKTIQGAQSSELTSSGGQFESTLIDVVADLKQATGLNDIIITSGNDKFHTAHQQSWHFKGKGVDIASASLNNRDNRIKMEKAIINLMLSGKYNKDGMRLGAINEYDNPSSYATGGHFHISLSTDDAGRDGRECNLALSGIKSYAQIREMKTKGTTTSDNLVVEEPVENKTKRKSKRYYKIFDPQTKKVIIAKPRGENKLKLYTKEMDKLGTIELEGGSIMMTGNDNVKKDITSDEIGKAAANIFNKIKKQKYEPDVPAQSDSSADFKIDGDSKIKHRFSGQKAKNIRIIEEVAEDKGITNPTSLIAMLMVIGKETGFIPQNEKMNYSKERLPEVWGTFSKTGKMVPKGEGKYNYNEKATEYEHNPEKLANLVYGGKYGNTEPGDGWKYRGRGFNGITFKGGYERYGKLIGKDLVGNPDLLNDPVVAAEAVVAYFLDVFKAHGVDPNSLNNLDDAVAKYAKANAGWNGSQQVLDWSINNANKFKGDFEVA